MSDLVLVLGVAGGDGGVVEDAKAHAAVGGGMVAGRTRQAESVFRLAAQDGLDGDAGRPTGIIGGLERLAANVGVAGAQAHGPRLDLSPRPEEVLPRMAGQDLVVGGRTGLVGLERRKVNALGDCRADGLVALRTLHLAQAGHVELADLVVDQGRRLPGGPQAGLADQQGAGRPAQQRRGPQSECKRLQELTTVGRCLNVIVEGRWTVHSTISRRERQSGLA